MHNVRRRLQDTSWKAKAVARLKLNLLRGWSNWDITGMVGIESTGACFADRKLTVCETCVTVYGVKQDIWEINYVLWGMMTAGIGFPLYDAIRLAALWKTGKWAVWGEANSCRPKYQFNSTIVQWIATGHAMYNSFFVTASDSFNAWRPRQSNIRYESCAKCGDIAGGPFSYRMLDDLEGAAASPPARK